MIFGIVGFAGSGKSTIGDILINDYGFKQESFANPVKDTASSIFNWDREMLEGTTKESRDWREQPDVWWEEKLNWKDSKFSKLFPRFTPRVSLQLIGTDLFRKNFSNNLWILSLENRIKSQSNNFVITDCRFPNELDSIRAMGGKIIRVKRGPEPEWWDVAEAANSDTFLHAPECADSLVSLGIHYSEWAWVGQKFDYVINNESTTDALKVVLDDIIY